jgi:hypothetical protein
MNQPESQDLQLQFAEPTYIIWAVLALARLNDVLDSEDDYIRRAIGGVDISLYDCVKRSGELENRLAACGHNRHATSKPAGPQNVLAACCHNRRATLRCADPRDVFGMNFWAYEGHVGARSSEMVLQYNCLPTPVMLVTIACGRT